MAKRIIRSDEAQSDVRAIDQKTAYGLLRGLSRVAFTESGEVRQLAGYDPAQFRLRLGDYRIRFRRTADSIQIVRVEHRSRAYR